MKKANTVCAVATLDITKGQVKIYLCMHTGKMHTWTVVTWNAKRETHVCMLFICMHACIYVNIQT